jgi:hypothetical protein
MPQQIAKYDIAWSFSRNLGMVRIWAAGSTLPLVLDNLSADRFSAMALILQQSPVFISPQGVIHTGPEAPGDN